MLLAPNIARAIRDNDPRYKIFLLEEAKKRGLYVDDLEEHKTKSVPQDYDVDEGAGDNIFGEKSDYEDSGNHESEGSEIEGKLNANPELLGEKEHEGDVYAIAFPKARISRTHGLGLVVGGKGRVQLAQAVAALEESRAENRDLRQMVETLMAKSEKMEVKSEKMEEQYNEIKTFLIASQKQQASQHDGKTHGDIEAEAKVEASQLQDDVKNRNQILTQRKTQEPGDSQTKKSYEELQSETTMLHKVKVEKVEERDAEQALQTTMLHKVKVEKVEERNAEQERIGRVQGKVKKTSGQSKAKKVKVAKNNVTEENLIKRGMEVGLTSPNSAQLVALGTVQNVDKAATCLDGKPLCDYVEILINVVLKGTTTLPRAQGRVTNMGTAQAMSIPWPRGNITQSDGSSLHSKVSTMISERSVNLKEAAAAKKQAKSQAEMIASESQSQNVAANTCKKRRISGKGEAKIKKMSQAIAK